MRRFLFGFGFLLALTVNAAAATTDFSRWAVLIVSGDNRAHSGAPSKVFDNARHDLARAFAGIGFTPGNMAQFAVTPDPAAQTTGIRAVANTLWDLSNRAPDGCLIYFTSHGVPEGIVMDEDVLEPARLGAMVNNACGAKPAVIVMSACYSGQFVPALAGDNRVVMTASRFDRTSFGCGELDEYTFFDDCFLRALPKSGGFPQLGALIGQCVAFREQQLDATPPSEPQLRIGKSVATTLRWK